MWPVQAPRVRAPSLFAGAHSWKSGSYFPVGEAAGFSVAVLAPEAGTCDGEPRGHVLISGGLLDPWSPGWAKSATRIPGLVTSAQQGGDRELWAPQGDLPWGVFPRGGMAEDVRGGPGHLGCAEAQGRRQVRVWRGRGPAQGLCDSTEPGWAVGAGAGAGHPGPQRAPAAFTFVCLSS